MTHRALIVIDVQNEYDFGRLPITFPPPADSLAAIGRAMDAATAAGVLVVVVQQDFPVGGPAFVAGTPEWELQPAVGDRHRDHLVHKPLPGAFTGTDLEHWLRSRDVTTVTLIGYMTQHCVDSTARQAMHAGFTVEVLADATGTLDYANAAGTASAEELHRGHLTALHGGIAAVATTEKWIAALTSGAALPADNPMTSARAALAVAL